jgi:hypothetical protein
MLRYFRFEIFFHLSEGTHKAVIQLMCHNNGVELEMLPARVQKQNEPWPTAIHLFTYSHNFLDGAAIQSPGFTYQ